MANVTAIFSDVGGVILTNGWDRGSRRRACEKFGLDWEEFENRHELMLNSFEVGQASLEEYLERTVFYRSRPFSRDDFKAFMFEQSQPIEPSLAVYERIARARKYLLATLNNESLEINEHRIRKFHLHQYFTIFLSSCYLGVRKPQEEIYRLALKISQRAPEECLFVDDRNLNLECAARLGMHTIHCQNPEQLEEELRLHGVEFDSKQRGAH